MFFFMWIYEEEFKPIVRRNANFETEYPFQHKLYTERKPVRGNDVHFVQERRLQFLNLHPICIYGISSEFHILYIFSYLSNYLLNWFIDSVISWDESETLGSYWLNVPMLRNTCSLDNR